MTEAKRRYTVVVADDSRAMRVALGVLLERTEFKVVGEAKDGVEAIQRCMMLRPNLLILDVDMPRLNGLECITDVRKASPSTKIIVCSGFSSPDVADYALRYSASAYVVKDNLREQLLRELRRAMP
jgi:DNA-binding NarL/FixJ family response regulator